MSDKIETYSNRIELLEVMKDAGIYSEEQLRTFFSDGLKTFADKSAGTLKYVPGTVGALEMHHKQEVVYYAKEAPKEVYNKRSELKRSHRWNVTKICGIESPEFVYLKSFTPPGIGIKKKKGLFRTKYIREYGPAEVVAYDILDVGRFSSMSTMFMNIANSNAIGDTVIEYLDPAGVAVERWTFLNSRIALIEPSRSDYSEDDIATVELYLEVEDVKIEKKVN